MPAAKTDSGVAPVLTEVRLPPPAVRPRLATDVGGNTGIVGFRPVVTVQPLRVPSSKLPLVKSNCLSDETGLSSSCGDCCAQPTKPSKLKLKDQRKKMVLDMLPPDGLIKALVHRSPLGTGVTRERWRKQFPIPFGVFLGRLSSPHHRVFREGTQGREDGRKAWGGYARFWNRSPDQGSQPAGEPCGAAAAFSSAARACSSNPKPRVSNASMSASASLDKRPDAISKPPFSV